MDDYELSYPQGTCCCVNEEEQPQNRLLFNNGWRLQQEEVGIWRLYDKSGTLRSSFLNDESLTACLSRM